MNVLGAVNLHPCTRQQLVDTLLAILPGDEAATVMLVGVPAAVSAREDGALRAMYAGATLAVIDGMPLVKKARRLGLAAERCSGPDIMLPVLQAGIPLGKRHFFYGGKDDQALSQLIKSLRARCPGLCVAGAISPPYRPPTAQEDAATVACILKARPDFVWVGIGAPKQELWMQAHQAQLPGTILLGVGAAFDFFAGTLDKAPGWMERHSLEWLYRLIKEPRRLWRRYLLGGVKYAWYSLFPLKGSG